MRAETKKALDRLDAAIGQLETSRDHVSPASSSDPETKAELKAIRTIVDEAISLLDPDAAKVKQGAE